MDYTAVSWGKGQRSLATSVCLSPFFMRLSVRLATLSFCGSLTRMGDSCQFRRLVLIGISLFDLFLLPLTAVVLFVIFHGPKLTKVSFPLVPVMDM